MDNRYVDIISKEPDSCYGVTFPDFPGCVSAGNTPEQAQDNAQEALAFHIKGMREDGDKLPVPTPIEKIDVASIAKDERAYLIFVTINRPG